MPIWRDRISVYALIDAHGASYFSQFRYPLETQPENGAFYKKLFTGQKEERSSSLSFQFRRKFKDIAPLP